MIIEAAVKSKAFKKGRAWEKNLVKGKDRLGLSDFVGHLSLDVTNRADALLLLALYNHCFGCAEAKQKGSIKVFDSEGNCMITYGYQNTQNEIHIYRIGSDGTEYYAAHSEEEMRQYYREICGTEDYCEEDLKERFEEVTDIDTEFDYSEDGKKIKTTWRKLAEASQMPCQISTGYN